MQALVDGGLGALIFATMGGVREVRLGLVQSSAELVFYRGLIGIVFLWVLARSSLGVTLGTRLSGHACVAQHDRRGLAGPPGSIAIAHMPLATAMTLNYMSSVWVAAFLVGGAWPGCRCRAATGRMPRPPLQGPLVLHRAGRLRRRCVLMLKPTVGANQGFAGLMGLLSGLTAAFAYMQVVALSRLGEPEARTVFYFAVGSAVAGGLGTLLGGATPWSEWTWGHAVWLLPVGVLAALGQLCMTRAYASAKTESGTLLVANLQYSGMSLQRSTVCCCSAIRSTPPAGPAWR